MKIINKSEKIKMRFTFEESEEIFNKYVQKMGYKILEETLIGKNEIEVILIKGEF